MDVLKADLCFRNHQGSSSDDKDHIKPHENPPDVRLTEDLELLLHQLQFQSPRPHSPAGIRMCGRVVSGATSAGRSRSSSVMLSRSWSVAENRDQDRNEKAAHSTVSSSVRYYITALIEDNRGISERGNDVIYEILSRKLRPSCYLLPSCGGEMKEKLYIKTPGGALCQYLQQKPAQ